MQDQRTASKEAMNANDGEAELIEPEQAATTPGWMHAPIRNSRQARDHRL
jgi:hypothetical protein